MAPGRRLIGGLTTCPHGTAVYQPPMELCDQGCKTRAAAASCPKAHVSMVGMGILALRHHEQVMKMLDPTCRCAHWTWMRNLSQHIYELELDHAGRDFIRNIPVPPRMSSTRMYLQRPGLNPLVPSQVFWTQRDWTDEERRISRRGRSEV